VFANCCKWDDHCVDFCATVNAIMVIDICLRINIFRIIFCVPGWEISQKCVQSVDLNDQFKNNELVLMCSNGHVSDKWRITGW